MLFDIVIAIVAVSGWLVAAFFADAAHRYRAAAAEHLHSAENFRNALKICEEELKSLQRDWNVGDTQVNYGMKRPG